jgi:LacI family transcriptional regulator, galactose operon repressor
MNDSSSDDAGLGKVKAAPGARTIRDVARLAGVSIGTVSKALNANGRLSAETRAKVLEVAKAIDYRPNDLAQSLHRARSMTVGILSNDSFGRFAFPIVEALERRLFDHGIAVFMCNATDDPVRERRHIDQLLGKRVDGLVVTARRADRAGRARPAGGLCVLAGGE